MEKKKQFKKKIKSQRIRIIDPHNRPKRRIKGVQDVHPREGIYRVWDNVESLQQVYIPKESVPGYNLSWIEDKVKPEKIQKY